MIIIISGTFFHILDYKLYSFNSGRVKIIHLCIHNENRQTQKKQVRLVSHVGSGQYLEPRKYAEVSG